MLIYPQGDQYIQAEESECFTITVPVPDVELETGSGKSVSVPVPDIDVDVDIQVTAVLDMSEFAIALHDSLRDARLLKFADQSDDTVWAATATAHQNAMNAVVQGISDKLHIQLEI